MLPRREPNGPEEEDTGHTPFGDIGIVDAWVNHVSPEAARAWLAREDMENVVRQFHRGATEWGQTSQELAEAMDRSGIVHGLLTSVPLIVEYANFEEECGSLLKVMNEVPRRFDALPFLDTRQPLEAVRNLEYAVKGCGFVGARIFPAAIGLAPNDRRCYPVYSKACELEVPITVNVGTPGPNYPAEPARPLHLDDVCRDFPDLKLVATHMGHPWETELVSLMAKYPNLFLMTSAWAPRYYPADILRFLNSRGREKVMFASDHPLVSFARCVREFDDLDLDPDVWPLFLGGNAVRVFKLDVNARFAGSAST